MTEKQYTIVNMGLDGQYIKENGKIITIERVVDLLNENEQLKKEGLYWSQNAEVRKKEINRLKKENEQLKSENKRLTDKLNQTALELVDGVISQGKATEISEMSYSEFLDYRAEHGKPMELQL